MTIRKLLSTSVVLFSVLVFARERAWPAESKITVTTNFYTVTGASFAEIRASIAQARPWKTNLNFDAYTHWGVNWRYQYADKNGQLRVDGFDPQTKVVVTLPRWTPPAGVSADVVKQWVQFLRGLMLHEEGHVRLAREATAEIRREVAALGGFASRPELKEAINRTANEVLDKYRQKERDYDRKTFHGATQGAHFRY